MHARTSRFLQLSCVAFSATVAAAQPYAYVSNLGANNVSVVNLSNFSVSAYIPVPAGPTGVAFAPDGSTVWVASQSANVVSAVSTASNSVTVSIPVGSTPTQLAISPDGTQVYVVDQGSNQVSVIDTALKAVTATINVGSRPAGIAFSPDGSRAYVSNLWSANVSVIDTGLKAVINTFPAASGPSGMAVSPDGGTVYVANEYAGSVTVHDSSGNLKSAIGGLVFPNALAMSPNGGRLLVTNGNSGSVSQIDTGSKAVVANVAVSSLPTAVSISSDGARAYVANEYGFSVSVIDMASFSVINTVNRVGVFPVAIAVAPAASAPPPPVCAFSISAASASYGQGGGSGSVTVSTPSGCSWNATSNSGWISVTGGTTGSGPGAVSYAVNPNGTTLAQTGTIAIAGQTFTVTETGISCSYALSASGATIGTGGGSGSVNLNAPSGCPWTVSSDSAWLGVTSNASGTGAGVVTFSAASNGTTSARTGNLSVGGQPFAVSQSGVAFTIIRVNAGGPAMKDGNGNVWAADSLRNTAFTTAPIANTSLQALYQKEAWAAGTLQYQFSVPNGSFTVNLHFAEIYMTQRFQRVFNIVINGNLVYQNFDIVAQTGVNTAYDLSFPVTVSGGQITIQLVPVTGNPKVSGIEIY